MLHTVEWKRVRIAIVLCRVEKYRLKTLEMEPQPLSRGEKASVAVLSNVYKRTPVLQEAKLRASFIISALSENLSNEM